MQVRRLLLMGCRVRIQFQRADKYGKEDGQAGLAMADEIGRATRRAIEQALLGEGEATFDCADVAWLRERLVRR